MSMINLPDSKTIWTRGITPNIIELVDLMLLVEKNMNSILLLLRDYTQHLLISSDIGIILKSIKCDVVLQVLILDFQLKNKPYLNHRICINLKIEPATSHVFNGFDNELYKLLMRSYNIQKILSL